MNLNSQSPPPNEDSTFEQPRDQDGPGPEMEESGNQPNPPFYNNGSGSGSINDNSMNQQVFPDGQDLMSQPPNVFPDIGEILPPANTTNIYYIYDRIPQVQDIPLPPPYMNYESTRISQEWSSYQNVMNQNPNLQYPSYWQEFQQPPTYYDNSFSGYHGEMAQNTTDHRQTADIQPAKGIQAVANIYEGLPNEAGATSQPEEKADSIIANAGEEAVTDIYKNVSDSKPTKPKRVRELAAKTKGVSSLQTYRPRKLPIAKKSAYKRPITKGMKTYLPKIYDPEREAMLYQQSTRLLTSLGLQPLECPKLALTDSNGRDKDDTFISSEQGQNEEEVLSTSHLSTLSTIDNKDNGSSEEE